MATKLTFEHVRAIALALPEVDEGTSYGTAAFKVAKKLFARLKEDGETLVVKIDLAEREMRMRSEPETFFITDHYRDHPWILVRIARVSAADLRELLHDAWRLAAPPRVIAAHEARKRGK